MPIYLICVYAHKHLEVLCLLLFVGGVGGGEGGESNTHMRRDNVVAKIHIGCGPFRYGQCNGRTISGYLQNDSLEVFNLVKISEGLDLHVSDCILQLVLNTGVLCEQIDCPR